MRGDFSRLTFKPESRYAGVLHQQGRVWLDADWNEDVLTRLHLMQQQARDFVGPNGTPQPGSAFAIKPSAPYYDADAALDFDIVGGRYYVDGVMCDLISPASAVSAHTVASGCLRLAPVEADGEPFAPGQQIEVIAPHMSPQASQVTCITTVVVEGETCCISVDPTLGSDLCRAHDLQVRRLARYSEQPDYRPSHPLMMPVGAEALNVLIYLETWSRFVTALEDSAIREAALGGPDTSARLKTIVQVKARVVSEAEMNTFILRDQPTLEEAWRLLPNDGQGTLTIVRPDAHQYTGRANHLYRVEIHDGGEVAFRFALAQTAAAGKSEIVLHVDEALAQEQVRTLRQAALMQITDVHGRAESVTIVDVVPRADANGMTLVLTTAHNLTETYTVGHQAMLSNGIFHLANDRKTGDRDLELQAKLSDDQRRRIVGTGVARLRSRDGREETIGIIDAVDKKGRTHLTLDSSIGYDVTAGASVTCGVARFKVSYDNASSATAVQSIDRGATLMLDGLNRDDSTALRAGDLVEVCDDESELGRSCGDLAYLADDPQDAPGLIRAGLDRTLPTAFDPGKHITVRRWDAIGWASLRCDTATPDMCLEGNICIRFAGTALQTGDYWQFAARVAGGTVEDLDDAAPIGIARRRVPLALLEWKSSTDDCYRRDEVTAQCDQLKTAHNAFGKMAQLIREGASPFVDSKMLTALANYANVPPAEQSTLISRLSLLERTLASGVSASGCLTLRVRSDFRQLFNALESVREDDGYYVVVEPGQSLESILQNLPSGAVVVELRPGVHHLHNTIRIQKSHLTIRGSGATIECSMPQVIALEFAACHDVILHDLVIKRDYKGSATTQHGYINGMINFDQCRSVMVERCTIIDDHLPSYPSRACIVFRGTRAALQADLTALLDLKGPTATATAAALSASHLIEAIPALPLAGAGAVGDVRIRDCRVVASPGQGGLLVADCVGVTIDHNWFLARDIADRALYGAAILEAEDLTYTHNTASNLATVMVASGYGLMILGNQAIHCTMGLIARSTGPLLIEGNSITVDDGPALWVHSDHETVTVTGNRFHKARGPAGAVSILAHHLTFNANYARCDAKPEKANVSIRGMGNGSTIMVQGNTCLEGADMNGHGALWRLWHRLWRVFDRADQPFSIAVDADLVVTGLNMMTYPLKRRNSRGHDRDNYVIHL